MGAAVRQGSAAQPGGRAAGSLLLSSARLRASRPPSLPPSPLAAPARPPAPRSSFHLKIFKTLHINICALHNLTRALLIARSLMQPARPIAESSPGGSRADAARSAPRSAAAAAAAAPASSPLCPRPAAGFCPLAGHFYDEGARGGPLAAGGSGRTKGEMCVMVVEGVRAGKKSGRSGDGGEDRGGRGGGMGKGEAQSRGGRERGEPAGRG